MDMENENHNPHVDAELEAILTEYKKKRFFDMIIGPVISLVFHVILVFAMIFLITPEKINKQEDIEITMKPPPPEEKLEDEPDDEPDVEPITEPLDTPITDNAEPIDTPIDVPNVEAPVVDNTEIDVKIPEVKFNTSPITLPSILTTRFGSNKAAALSSGGGNKDTERAVTAGLNWLKEVQHEKGYWPKNSNPEVRGEHCHAMTALALLSYLANGKLLGDANFGNTIQLAINWLVDQIDEKTGLILPGIGTHGTGGNLTYANAIVCYALAETSAMMPQLGHVKPKLDSMIKKICESQREDGTWSYNYNPADHSDTSLAGWHIQALKAATAAGHKGELLEKVLEKASKMCTEAILDNGTGLYKVMEKEEPRLSIGSVAALCLQLLGEGRSNDKINKVVDRLKKELDLPPQESLFYWNQGRSQGRQADWTTVVYDWYYMTQVVFQKQDMQFWRKWNNSLLIKQIVRNQVRKKPEGKKVEIGYWNWPGNKEMKEELAIDGANWKRLYSTTLMCLTLQVYYRNLPTFKKPIEKNEQKAAAEALFGDGDDGLL